MNPVKTREIIEAKFDEKLSDLYSSGSLEQILFRLKAPGTRTECGFRVQVEVYHVVDGYVKDRPEDFHHVKYLGYVKVDYDPKTTELPEFFLKLGEVLLDYVKERVHK